MKARKLFLSNIATMAILFSTTACGGIIDEETELPTSSLSIAARSATDKLSYPILIYAFDANDKLASKTTIDNEEDESPLILNAGSYRLVTLAGTVGYILPESPTPKSLISMPEANYTTEAALQMGSVDVVVTDADAEADVTLSYRVARIELSLNDIPIGTKSVKVRFSPLYEAIDLRGTYAINADKTGGTASVTCTADATDATLWKAPVFYTLPSSETSFTLSIELTAENGTTKTYGYTCPEKLEAAIPLALTGSYKKGFNVNENITTDGWGETKNISFIFGEASGDGLDNGNSDSDDNSGNGDSEDAESNNGTESDNTLNADGTYTVATLPQPCSMWNGHFVVGITKDAAGTGADVLLLSLKEWQSVASAKKDGKETEAIDIVAAYTEAEAAGWSIPTTDGTAIIKATCRGKTLINKVNALLTEAGGDALSYEGTDNDGNSSVRYLCDEATYGYSLEETVHINKVASSNRSYYLRAVKAVRLTTTDTPKRNNK